MLDRNLLLSALEARSAEFTHFEHRRQSILQRLRDALTRLETRGFAEGLVRPFATSFRHHPEALAWGQRHLEGWISFAADGSQIEPDNRYSLPVALIQVGTYENHHLSEGSYRKETMLDVLTPGDLDSEGPVKRLVDLARFELEIEALIRFMRERPPEPPCLVYLDGSLIVSFADRDGQDPLASRYVSRILALLDTAEETRTPLIAYVDGSRAKDVVRLVAAESGEEEEGVTDAMLLDGRLNWGDRTAAFRCERDGVLEGYGRHRREIAFCYLQTREAHPPARLEFPAWMLEGLEPILDAVRADAIAGGGYPYTLAAADATAVLTTSDRERFQRTLEDFLSQKAIPLSFGTKALSKLRRR